MVQGDDDWRGVAQVCPAWPFEEARKLLARFERDKTFPDVVRFETGYGPSGLPHIGTFGEVVRTNMVKGAFETLAPGVPTELVCFSDDMDALRKVPDNVPNQDLLAHHLGQPLTRVPDPFGQYPSFGAHNNARLKTFLDTYTDAPYTFMSATECYRGGLFNDALKHVLTCHQAILDIMLPSLGQERQATYSPILPICPRTGRVLLVPLTHLNEADASVTYTDPETGALTTVSILDGHCKLQWKADWAMRWVALDIHYEMSGKDLIDSFALASKICRALGHHGPEKYHYELFLDEEGKKISKSKGNGLSVEDWLKYAPPESLKYFMYQSPRVAKKLHFGVIPKMMDDYLMQVRAFPTQTKAEKLNNPIWHLARNHLPAHEAGPLSFALLLELVNASSAGRSPDLLWGFITRYIPEARPGRYVLLDRMVDCALRYFHDFTQNKLHPRQPTSLERAALADLYQRLEAYTIVPPSAEALQNILYQVGKDHGFPQLKDWFTALYEVLLGQSSGPRFGSFVALYGVRETMAMIERVL